MTAQAAYRPISLGALPIDAMNAALGTALDEGIAPLSGRAVQVREVAVLTSACAKNVG